VATLDCSTPVNAITEYCKKCAGDARAVMDCNNRNCPLWPWRVGSIPRIALSGESRVEAIKQKCMQCKGTFKEVRDCTNLQCPLYFLRFGLLASNYFVRIGTLNGESEKVHPLFLARLMAQMRDEGLSGKAIAQKLNEQGYRGSRGAKLSANTVTKLLNKYYPDEAPLWQTKEAQAAQERHQAIVRELKKGVSPTEIAEKLGTTRQRVKQIIEQEDIPFRPKGFPFFVRHNTPEERLAILTPVFKRFQRDNVSVQAACYLLNISEGQCREYCKLTGVKLRSIRRNYWAISPKVQRMLAEYIAGKSLKDIAKRYNYSSVSIVRAQARRYNIPGRPRGRRNAKPQEATEDG